MPLVYIGLGSNLGDRKAYLHEAVRRMSEAGINVIRSTGIIETEPVENTSQPRFLNQVVLAETVIEPLVLMDRLLEIERTMGRVRDIPRGPRIIDLDVLLYDRLVLNSDKLVIPHPGILRREFILRHLVELDPGLRDPLSGKAYIEYRDMLKVRPVDE